MQARGEVEKLKAEIMRMELDGKKMGQDYEMKKLEFQKEMMDLQTKQAIEKQQLIQQQPSQQPLARAPSLKPQYDENASAAWDLERVELTKKVRDLQRKVEELTDDIKLTEEANLDLKAEKSRLQLQLEEIRT